MKNFIGEELHIGDKVVYINRHITGSSSTNKTLRIGKIIRFTPKQVVIDTEKNTGVVYFDEYKVDPDWIACIYEESETKEKNKKN